MNLLVKIQDYKYKCCYAINYFGVTKTKPRPFAPTYRKKDHKCRRITFGNVPNHLASNQKRSSEEQLVLRTWIPLDRFPAS